jgi:hypothetical protein
MDINNYQVFVRQLLPRAERLRQNIESQERANLHTTSYILYNPHRHGLRVEVGGGGRGEGDAFRWPTVAQFGLSVIRCLGES